MLNEEIEPLLRRALAEVTSEVPVPPGLAARVRGQRRKARGRKAAVAGVVALAAVLATAAGTAIALSGGRASARRGTTVRLASFSLRLPPGYHQAAARPSPECDAAIFYGLRPWAVKPAVPARAEQEIMSQPKIETAVDRVGGCVLVGESWAYTPGAAFESTGVVYEPVTPTP